MDRASEVIVPVAVILVAVIESSTVRLAPI